MKKGGEEGNGMEGEGEGNQVSSGNFIHTRLKRRMLVNGMFHNSSIDRLKYRKIFDEHRDARMLVRLLIIVKK